MGWVDCPELLDADYLEGSMMTRKGSRLVPAHQYEMSGSTAWELSRTEQIGNAVPGGQGHTVHAGGRGGGKVVLPVPGHTSPLTGTVAPPLCSCSLAHLAVCFQRQRAFISAQMVSCSSPLFPVDLANSSFYKVKFISYDASLTSLPYEIAHTSATLL